jgi:muramoyltetrapeptide carboxypeptidase
MLAKSLQKGDTIGIIAPSNPITQDRRYLLDNAIKKFENLGFKVIYSKNCFNIDKYEVSSGEPQERANDLNEMFSNPKIKAIYCAHGGDTANQILSLIDYGAIKKNPKIFLGMSDNDVLNLAINTKTDLVVFHGSDPKSGRNLDLDIDYTWQNFQDRLINKSKSIPASSERICVREGITEGKIIGCNLSSILKLAGTSFFPNYENSILFLEGYSKNTKKTICKLQQLKEIGVFDKIKGIVIGFVVGFQDEGWIKENNIKVKYEDIVLEITKEYNFPILKTNDFGHKCPNCYLPIGGTAILDAKKKSIEIIDDFLN